MRFFYLVVALLGLPALVNAEAGLSNERFGQIQIFRERPKPNAVVILFSGDAGFDEISSQIARRLARTGALVLGISSPHYLDQIRQEDENEECSYLAGEITRLSQSAQSTLQLASYQEPIIAGVGTGASLAYAITSEYPSVFRGLLTMGFCPEFPSSKTLCEGEFLRMSVNAGRGLITPNAEFIAPWVALQGSVAPRCAPAVTTPFISPETQSYQGIGGVDDSFAEVEQAGEAIDQAMAKLVAVKEKETKTESEVDDLPIVEILPKDKDNMNKDFFFFMISGDGGWAEIDKEIGGYAKERNFALVGLDALRYFWKKKSPDTLAEDINKALRYYKTKFGCDRAVLLGYSLGADVLPFVVTRLSKDNKTDLALAALLNPGQRSDFEIHISDWLGVDAGEEAFDVVAEMRKMKNVETLCIYGKEDDEQSCTTLLQPLREGPPATVIGLDGDHHFNGDYTEVSRIILEKLSSLPKREKKQ